jgi:uncharacterized protein (TIGR02145 family)
MFFIKIKTMKTKFFLSILVLGLIVSAFGQKPTLVLTFTAIDNTSNFQLDSIKVMNRTQGGDTVLYWPDTVIMLHYQVGINEINNEGKNLQVFQNYPNPVKDQTTITLYVPEKDKVGVMISDMLGRKVINTERLLERGYHSFRFTPGSGEIYFFTAFWKATSSSIKILTPGNSSVLTSLLEYTGSKIIEPQFKRIDATTNFSFSLGNKLLYIGYANGLQSGMLDAPGANETYTFQFATNIPCPGTPTVTYEGQVYNTIQIFNQCWLKENLNIGTRINASQDQTDNGIIEKYCYLDNETNCDKYGGLYQWNEIMQYTTIQGTKGICPDGWHIPTDEEWKVLEGTVDSQYGVGDPEWDETVRRGYDAGEKIKSTTDWYSNGNGTNNYEFTGLPGSACYYGIYGQPGYSGDWWSSSECSDSGAWKRNLYYNNDDVYRSCYYKPSGFSVRCLKD